MQENFQWKKASMAAAKGSNARNWKEFENVKEFSATAISFVKSKALQMLQNLCQLSMQNPILKNMIQRWIQRNKITLSKKTTKLSKTKKLQIVRGEGREA